MKLQQYLPLAVLKRRNNKNRTSDCSCKLQQYLPLAVLKPLKVACDKQAKKDAGCNSTYRLRY